MIDKSRLEQLAALKRIASGNSDAAKAKKAVSAEPNRTGTEKKEPEQRRQQGDDRKRPPQKQFNSYDVERWFKNGIQMKYGNGFITSAWAVKERALATKMINEYGGDLVREAVDHMFAKWDSMVAQSGGRLYGVPNIPLLWGMRASIFGDVQAIKLGMQPKQQQQQRQQGVKISKGKRDSDEFSGGDGSPGVGW